MFDYGAAGRSWGEGNGINDTGLVTFDRKYCKDAFYFYKANGMNTNRSSTCPKGDEQALVADTGYKGILQPFAVELIVNG